ncbi:MAG: L-seryl-tRNA(Sec) selenium transferase [Fimbriimonadaceae bacterium]|nr:L-seryl-tRNA(Sec) selenium transferase [Fimbriimonadaceae bacterium]QYK55457.1 MAG: L-seryl-tRNA(Sec) selenium transferase [Fimbriimonadaceae bacterium]
MRSVMSAPDLRLLPSVDRLASAPELSGFAPQVSTAAAREAIEHFRAEARNGRTFDLARVVQEAVLRAERMARPSLAPAVNMSGVVLHTGLGRSRWAPSVVAQVAQVLRGHSNTEIDLETGARGDRQAHVRSLLQGLTGAEDALVVNNCAAAVFLTLHTLCRGKPVLLSRGQMVEIGGSFRMPDIVRSTGCRLVEVGCTNKTRLQDYAGALEGPDFAILRCHPSNYRIVGFTEQPAPSHLAALAHAEGGHFIDDAGSGCLLQTERFGLPHERTLREAVADGADIVTASGDKLLGGPQAGLVLGTRAAVAALRASDLHRTFRVDKATLAGLEATLRLYAEERELEIPTWRYAARPLDEVGRLATTLAGAWPSAVVEDGVTEMGGGSMPGSGIPTRRVGLPSASAETLAARLRSAPTPIIGRIERDMVWLDPRTAEADEVAYVAQALGQMR